MPARNYRRIAGIALCSLAVCVSVAAVPSGAPPAKPASDIEPLVQGTVHDALFAASFDGAQGIAAGAAGELRTSSDGGKTWRTEKLETQGLSLLGVAALGGRQIAVGQQGMVFTRADGAWTPGKSGTQQRLFSVAMHRSGLALTVGAFGTLLRSTDAGASWTPVALDWMEILGEQVEPHLYAVDIDEAGVATAVGEFGLVLRSTDGGEHWQRVRKDEASLFGVQVRADGIGYAVGQSGSLLRSSDGGQSWQALKSGTGEILLGVWSSGDTVVVAGMRELLASRDGGQSWKLLRTGDLAPGWFAAATGSGDAVFAVGQYGRIVKIGG